MNGAPADMFVIEAVGISVCAYVVDGIFASFPVFVASSCLIRS